MAEFKAGTLVWVQRKNNSWWPGRIMDRNDLSSSPLNPHFSKPVQLLGRQNGSVDWYNLESKRIKVFRCSEFNDFIKRAESLKASPFRKPLKYGHRTDAILHALEIENKELGKKRKLTDCGAEKLKNDPVCRSKRSRCVYLPVGSRNSLERTSFHVQPLQILPHPARMGSDSYQSSSFENSYSSRSSEAYTSNNDTPNGGRDEAIEQLSGCCFGHPGSKNCKKHEELSGLTPKNQTAADVEAPKRKLILKLKHLNKRYRDVPDGQRYISSGNAIHDKSDLCTVDDALKYHIRTGCYGKQSKKLISDICFPSQSQDGGLEIPGRQTRSGSSRTMLIDVKLTVEARYQGAPVPLVSLVSKTSGKSIVGYPFEVEALKDGSTEILLPMNDDGGNQMLDDKGTSLLQSIPNIRTPVCYLPTTSPLTRSVRATARRTPVSYLPTPSPFSIPKDVQAVNVSTKETHARLGKRENKSLPKEKLLKQVKECILSKQKVAGDFETAGWNCFTDQQIRRDENLPAVVTCVPVKLVFSKLMAAIGLQPGADIHD